MSMDMEDNHQLDAESILHDVMDNICKYLNRKELCNLAEVCKSWRDAALREKAKRYYIQHWRLLYKFGNLDSLLNVEPYVSLLIYDSKLEKSLNNLQDLKKKVLKQFKKKQPHKAIVLAVKEYLTTEDVDIRDRNDQCELKSTSNIQYNILGLFFPSVHHRLCVRVAWNPGIRLVEFAFGVADRFAEKLRLGDCKYPKSALLLFIEPYEPGAAMVAHDLRNRIKDDNETLWVCEVGEELVTANYHRTGRRKKKTQCIVALRISGPTVESWTECINLRLPREEVERKLIELNEKVTLKKYCTALISAPYNSPYGCSHEIMRNVKRIFPEITFVGLFNHHNKTIRFSASSENWEDDVPIFHVEDYTYISLIIITYD